MRLPPLFVVCCLVTLLPPAAGEDIDVRITEVLADPDGGREFVELQNQGSTAVQLENRTLSDTAGNVFTFPPWLLQPGAYVVVWGGGDGDATGPAWSRASVWNNGGDTVNFGADTMSYASSSPGMSWSLVDGSWVETEPSPGAAPASTHGFQFQVDNVPPTIDAATPGDAAPGQTITFTATVADANDDLRSWALIDPAGTIASGNGDGALVVEATAPAAPGPWTLMWRADDHGDNFAFVNVTVLVLDGPFVVSMPAGGIGMPALVPGAVEVEAARPFTIENRAGTAVVPYIDISDFTGPQALTAAGHVRLTVDIGGQSEVLDYGGPLTALPELPAGSTADVTLALVDLPSPLAAGTYGTSFAVSG